MGEMIERVARALFEKGPSKTRPAPGWEYLTEDWKEAFRATARVAIGAMREPTEAMTGAPCDASIMVGDPSFLMSSHEAEEAWRAMIDEALKA